MSSGKKQSIDNKIIKALASYNLSGKIQDWTAMILEDREILAAQEYANNVSIVRLGYNDHGPVHMRTVVLNTIIMMNLLRQAGVKTSLEKEGVGDFEDSLLGAIFGAMLHDIGMCVSRQDHETHSAYMAMPIMERLLSSCNENIEKKVIIRSIALEAITGHMGTRKIHSLEAGVAQIADGCDMTKGRARIPLALSQASGTGTIHQYSANSIEEVQICKGLENPIRIEVLMSSEVGLFQVEEVLLVKIAASTAKSHIELFTQVEGFEPKRYL